MPLTLTNDLTGLVSREVNAASREVGTLGESIVFLLKRSDLVAKHDLSFPRKRESKSHLSSWIPTFVGMT